jgi:hypothetical protein
MKIVSKKTKPKKTGAEIEQANAATFILLAKTFGITGIVREHLFASEIGRRWRFDFALPKHRIGIEIEGGAWSNGRHTRGAGFVGDMEKYNMATVLGWRVLRFTPQQIKKAETYELISKLINIV